ncbi:putative quinol monooxygenase [Pseudomonas sp. C11]|uniref:putative quinol monooxygenase n=1 Tax=Pseudomonas sp. C11 TaxID=3075550 RepID=UPI003A521535
MATQVVFRGALTLGEPGCIGFTVTENAENPLRFEVFEEFVDRQAFDFHQTRVRASRWGQVTVDVTRHYEVFE